MKAFTLNPYGLAMYGVKGKKIGTEVVKKSERSEKPCKLLHCATTM